MEGRKQRQPKQGKVPSPRPSPPHHPPPPFGLSPFSSSPLLLLSSHSLFLSSSSPLTLPSSPLFSPLFSPLVDLLWFFWRSKPSFLDYRLVKSNKLHLNHRPCGLAHAHITWSRSCFRKTFRPFVGDHGGVRVRPLQTSTQQISEDHSLDTKSGFCRCYRLLGIGRS